MPKQEDKKRRDTQVLLPAAAMTVAGIASFLSYFRNWQTESLYPIFLMVLTAFSFASALVLFLVWFLRRGPVSDLGSVEENHGDLPSRRFNI